jgi:hypothetical protein
MATFYDFFKDFQGIIGNLFGFIGVILTLWYNGRKDRNLHLWKVGQERKSIAAAFKAELEAMASPLEKDIDNMDMAAGGFVAVPKEFIKPTFFLSSAAKVSLLDENIAEKVIKAYSFVDEYPKLLVFAVSVLDQNDSRATEDRDSYYLVRSPRAGKQLVALRRDILKNIKDAIDKLGAV